MCLNYKIPLQAFVHLPLSVASRPGLLALDANDSNFTSVYSIMATAHRMASKNRNNKTKEPQQPRLNACLKIKLIVPNSILLYLIFFGSFTQYLPGFPKN